MSQFPHPPQSSSRRMGRGGIGNTQYNSTCQELDLRPEKYLLPKGHCSLLNNSPKCASTTKQHGPQLTRSCSPRSPLEARPYTSISSNPEPGSPACSPHVDKGLEVRTWERWSRSIQQGKSKDLSAEVGTADKWRSKLLKSLATEVNNMKKKSAVDVGLAEEWRSKILKSLAGVDNDRS